MTADSAKQAIVFAARKAFTRYPYATVTLRAIAADAGVSASLIVKHFGGKESLFHDTVADFSEAADGLLAAPTNQLAQQAVLTLVRYRRRHNADPLLRVLFTVGRDDERSILRDRFQTQLIDRVAALLVGDTAQLRAEMFVSGLLGLGAVMAVNKTGAIRDASPELVVELYAPALQAIIDGP